MPLVYHTRVFATPIRNTSMAQYHWPDQVERVSERPPTRLACGLDRLVND
jgi:hypothetical protein